MTGLPPHVEPPDSALETIPCPPPSSRRPGRRKPRAVEDFDCGADFLARVELLRDAKELEWAITDRLEHVLEFIELLHGDDPLDWAEVRHVLARAGMSDPECWPAWCFRRVGRVGDSEDMEQAELGGIT